MSELIMTGSGTSRPHDSQGVDSNTKLQELADEGEVLPLTSATEAQDETQATTKEAAQEESEEVRLQDLVAELQATSQQVHRRLEFSIQDDVGQTVITVVDKNTEEVIRQIPSEEALDVARNFRQGNFHILDLRA